LLYGSYTAIIASAAGAAHYFINAGLCHRRAFVSVAGDFARFYLRHLHSHGHLSGVCQRARRATSRATGTVAGLATAIVRTQDLIDSNLVRFASGDYLLNVTDITDKDNPQLFYGEGEFQVPAYARSLVFKQEIAVGGRTLLVTVSPTENVSLQSWFVLAGGLLFCSLLGGFLLLISGRTQHITNLVEQRTKELAAVLENSVESILVVYGQGLIEQANPAAAQLFRYPLAQFDGVHIADLIPALRAKFEGQGEELGAANFRESFGLRSDGSRVEVELTISTVAMRERKFFTFIIHDATAKRKVDRMKSEFISTVKFSRRYGLVRVSLACEGSHVKVSVSDEGPGMADDFRQRAFQRFAQVDSSDTRRRDGTGLGLSITKVIIERMEGTIDYQSVVDNGTTFYFTLPLLD
jgi:PAS domain S-box-containing protein